MVRSKSFGHKIELLDIGMCPSLRVRY